MRQIDHSILVRTYGLTFSKSKITPPASQFWDQLVYASSGVLTVRTDLGTWVVPPYRALWLPANTPCTLESLGKCALRMLYLRSEPGLQQQLPFSHDQCTVVSVSPLMRELILRTVSIGVLKIDMPSHQMLHELMFDELRAVNKMPLQLPYPTSKPAKDFIKILEQSSQNSFDIGAATKASGVSRRTLERLFPVETGMSLGQWVRRRKLLEGLQVFSEGATIADVAYRLGYSGPSAFISMFRRELGNTPRGYLSKD